MSYTYHVRSSLLHFWGTRLVSAESLGLDRGDFSINPRLHFHRRKDFQRDKTRTGYDILAYLTMMTVLDKI